MAGMRVHLHLLGELIHGLQDRLGVGARPAPPEVSEALKGQAFTIFQLEVDI